MSKQPARLGALPLARAPVPPGETPMPAAPRQGNPALRRVGTVAVVVLVDFRVQARWWAWSRLVLGRWPLRAVPGLAFAKVLGSGVGGGFGVRPSGTHQGLYLVFEDEASARSFVDRSALLESYREHAQDCCIAVLRASSSKGSWSGAAIEPTVLAPTAGPVAALTRASIRPRHARAFWRLSPPAEAALAAAPGCRLAAGLGEAPLLRQATFSLWTDVAAMDAYARSGAHQQAIRTAYAGDFFSESMFVRFVPVSIHGRWQGHTHG